MAFFNNTEMVSMTALSSDTLLNVAVIENMEPAHSPYRRHSETPDGWEIESWNGVYGTVDEALSFAHKVGAMGALVRVADGSGRWSVVSV